MSILPIKKILLALVISVSTVAFALPGIQSYTPDFSGEYVYYKDKSFTNDSVVGFLFYDDGTYAIRYYSPAAPKTQTPEKDITVYLTLDPAKNIVDFTGERIVGASNDQDDTDIVNYLHDLFYELTARRRKVELANSKNLTVSQDFVQFGGNVDITFSAYIPIFNVYSIAAKDKTIIFQVESTGKLTGSDDTRFTSYKGVKGLPKDKQRTFKKSSAKAQKIEFENQSLTIDSSWTQSMDNLWLLGDNAILTLNVIPVPSQYSSDPERFATMLKRKLIQGSDSFELYQQLQIKEQKNTTTITNVFYQPDNKDVIRVFNVIENNGNQYSYFMLTVFDSVYQKNKSYFDKIIKSYKVNL